MPAGLASRSVALGNYGAQYVPQASIWSSLCTVVLAPERDGRRAAGLVLTGDHWNAQTRRGRAFGSIPSTTVLTERLRPG